MKLESFRLEINRHLEPDYGDKPGNILPIGFKSPYTTIIVEADDKKKEIVIRKK